MPDKQQTKVLINSPGLALSLGLKPGDTTMVETFRGVPTVKEWRRRFNDAKTDKCLTILPKVETKKKGVNDADI